MNSKTRVFSFILAICLILNSGMSTSVFGANRPGFWLFSSGGRNSDKSSIAASREENGASDADIVDNADEVTEYEDADEQDDAPVIPGGLAGDMLVYKDSTSENGTVAEEVSLVYEDDDIFVTLTGAQEDLPEDGSLEVSEVHPTDNNSAEVYANAFTALTEKLQERGENYSDAKLYDFTTGTPPTTGTPSVSKTPTVTKKPTITKRPTTTPRTPTTSPRTPTSSSGDSTSKGDTTRSTTTTTTSVRTGDTSPVELYTVMAVAALLIIILLMKKKA